MVVAEPASEDLDPSSRNGERLEVCVLPEELPRFFDILNKGGHDFVNGTRMIYPMQDQAMKFLNLVGNKISSLIMTFLTGQNLTDTLCGTKVMFRDDYFRLRENRSFFGDFDPFGDYDLLFGAYKLNLKIIYEA